MKKYILLFIFIFLLFPSPIFSHGSGYPPFFKIDGKLIDPYFLQNVGVFSSTLNIPQDVANKIYIPNEPINFEIDMKPLESVFATEVMDKLQFIWDFGDGTRGEGIKNSHAYKKAGSYIVSISVDYGDPAIEPPVIETALVQVVPHRGYQLSKPVVKINDKKGTKENYSILDFDLKNALNFDASESKSSSSQIVSYEWDFGDDKSAKGKSVKHQYELPQAFATVVLRIIDKNGLFTDSYVNVRNTGKNEPSSELDLGKIAIVAVGAIILFGFGIGAYKLIKKK